VTPIEHAIAAIVADLQRQAASSGCTVETDGCFVQVDGSFEVEPLVRAVLTAIREPSEEMMEDGSTAMLEDVRINLPNNDVRIMWQTMIDTALAEGDDECPSEHRAKPTDTAMQPGQKMLLGLITWDGKPAEEE
jgi:hypothetical protein